jgi:hypothetical protein
MAKKKRTLIEKVLFEVYDKGLQQNDCNLTDYYEKILQALNIPLVAGQSEQLPPNPITDKEHKDLIKALYPKDNSKHFRR